VLISQQPRCFPTALFNFEFHKQTFAFISYTLYVCNLYVLFHIITATPFLKITIHESIRYAILCSFCLVSNIVSSFLFYALRN